MSEQASVMVTCVDNRTHELAGVKNVMLFLQMTAAAGVIVLLFVAQALIAAWGGCALAARSLRRCMTPASRNAFRRMCTWRQALYVFYLGTAGNWASGQPSWNCSSEPALVRAEVRVSSPSGSRMKLLEGSVGDR